MTDNVPHVKHAEATKLLHQINNEVQVVLGYLELDECDKARPHVKEMVKLLSKLAKVLALAPKTGKH
jgi:molybdopterin/thiamine biosynthesis adenylyltransferase